MRVRLTDLGGLLSLVVAVVPFGKVGIDDGVAEAGQLGGAAGSLQRAGEDLGEGQSAEPLAELSGVLLAVFGEGDVGPARVPAVEAPDRLTVAGEVDPGKRAHG